MIKLITPLLMLARLLIALQVILGCAIWFGVIAVTQIHIALGSLFVLDVWIIAVIALFALPRRALPFIAMVMGGIVMWFGVAQRTMMLGDLHWAVRVVHLLLGLATMGLVEPMAKAVKQHAATRS